MTSKQELEKLIENILEQGKVVTVNPDLILNVNVENFIPIIERACEELDRVEELKKDIVTAYESNKLLREENAKLKQKETPIKVKYVYYQGELVNAGCPNCENALGKHFIPSEKRYEWGSRYCPMCGQKLDWTKDDELLIEVLGNDK